MNRPWLLIATAILMAATAGLTILKIAEALTFSWWYVFAPILLGIAVLVGFLCYADFDSNDQK